MYRSVTESHQGDGKRRKHLRWLEGVGVGVVVFLVIFLLFGWG